MVGSSPTAPQEPTGGRQGKPKGEKKRMFNL